MTVEQAPPPPGLVYILGWWREVSTAPLMSAVVLTARPRAQTGVAHIADDAGNVMYGVGVSAATDPEGRALLTLVWVEGAVYDVEFGGVKGTLRCDDWPEGSTVPFTGIRGIPGGDGIADPLTWDAVISGLNDRIADQVPPAVASAVPAYLAAHPDLIEDAATAAIAAAVAAVQSVLDAKVDKGTLAINVADEGVILDGTTDNQTAMQAAADKARALGRALYVPAGDVWWSGEVKLYTSSRWDGTMIVKSAAPSKLTIARALAAVDITPSALGGLTAGSSRVTGAGGQVGTLMLYSTDELIKRDGNGSPYSPYLKQEVSAIGEDGRVVPPIAHTYDVSKLATARVHPIEPPVTVTGLTVQVTGTGSAGTDAYVQVERDNVTLDGFSAFSPTAADPAIALLIRECVGVRVERPVIEGFKRLDLGYGIFPSLAASVEIVQPQIVRCRHTITNTYAKDITVKGGALEGTADAHWCDGITFEGTKITVGPGESCVQVAGSDLTVQRCVMSGGRNMVGIREDTPELKGALTIRDTTWRPGSHPTVWAVGGASLNNGSTFDFGRTLTLPSSLTIDGLTIITAGTETGFVRVLSDTARSWSRTNWGWVRLSRIAHSGPALFSAATYELSGRAAGSPPLSLTVRECDFTASVTDHVYLSNTGEAAAGARLSVIDCVGTLIKMPEVGVASLLVRGGTLAQLYRTATAVAPSLGQIVLDGVEATALAVSGLFEWDLRGVTWSGAATSSNKTMDGRTRSITGGILRRVGSTGSPTQADGYKSGTYYA